MTKKLLLYPYYYCYNNKIIATSSSSTSSTTLSTTLSSSSSSSSSTSSSITTKISKLLSCGLLSGLIQAATFNPWDRALYLSVKENRNFLNPLNFIDPFAGVLQTIIQRTISSGLYFPLEEIFIKILKDNYSNILSPYWITLNAGNIAGAINGIIMNPVSSIKYHYWGHSECGKENFYSTAKEMYIKGGIKTFFVGATATIIRDILFGGSFSLLRHELLSSSLSSSSLSSSSSSSKIKSSLSKQQESFIINLISAMVATIISSPLNYVRNIHYSTPPNIKALSSFTILKNLYLESNSQLNIISKLHIIQNRLRIGWGTARVGCGMAFSANIYSFCSKSVDDT